MPAVTTWRASPRMYAAAGSAVIVWSMGITQHANGVDNVSAIVNLALARGNVGRKGAGLMPIRGHSGVQGGSEMGAYATSFPGGVSIDATSAAALSETYGIPIGAGEGLDRRRHGRGGRARRRRGPLLEWRQLPRRAAGPGVGRRTRSSACRCGCTRTSSCRARCSWTRARSSSCSPRAPATSSAVAAPRRRPSGGSSSVPRSGVRASARPAASGRSSRTSAAASVPTARTCSTSRTATRCATRSPGWCRPTAGSSTCRSSATRSSGAGRGSARTASSRPTDGKARFSPVVPAAVRATPRAGSCSAPGGASSSTRWSTPRSTR